MKRKLPPRNRDLKRYALRRKLLRVLGYTLWIAGFAFGAWYYNSIHQASNAYRRIVGWKLALWMLAAVLLGFFIFRIQKLFTQRHLEGTVVESGLSHSYTPSADPGVGNRLNYDFRVNTYLIVRTDRGKRRRIRFEQKAGFYLYYYPKTRLCRFSGLPYPIADPSSSYNGAQHKKRHHDDLSDGYLCVACGFLNNHDLSLPCGACGHSLIDPSEVWDSSDEKRKGSL